MTMGSKVCKNQVSVLLCKGLKPLVIVFLFGKGACPLVYTCLWNLCALCAFVVKKDEPRRHEGHEDSTKRKVQSSALFSIASRLSPE